MLHYHLALKKVIYLNRDQNLLHQASTLSLTVFFLFFAIAHTMQVGLLWNWRDTLLKRIHSLTQRMHSNLQSAVEL